MASTLSTLQRGVLSAAEGADALLVSWEKVYGYVPAGGKPMTEDLPLAATTIKGRTRAAMTRELLTAAEAGVTTGLFALLPRGRCGAAWIHRAEAGPL